MPRGVRHPQAVRERAIQLYRKGMPRAEVAKTLGIHLQTIHAWTRFIVSEPLTFIICVECGRKKRVRKTPQKYCSKRCRHHAYYHRKVGFLPTLPRRCLACEQPFITRHTKKRYCSNKCASRAGKQRERDRNRQKKT